MTRHSPPTPPARTGIHARGLTKRFGDLIAVDGVDFSVEPGRVTGFLGPNGGASPPRCG